MFILILVDDVNFASRDDKVFKGGDVRDVIVFVPRSNGGCTKEPVDEA